ncbi:MAG TPA: hypothetical protein VGI45_26880 [Terracidiphilus sp.]|jgi:hypothetical protein
MSPTNPIDAREAQIAKIAESEHETAALRRHLRDVINGPAFKGSHRSGQFLEYVVEQSLAGHFESLKERLIGVELFGRTPTYDSGEDAIVRVTASDVRKRLLQHYGKSGVSTEFRLALPIGSYIPEITRESHTDVASQLARVSALLPLSTGHDEPTANHSTSSSLHEPEGSTAPLRDKTQQPARAAKSVRLTIAIAVLLLIGLGVWRFNTIGFRWSRNAPDQPLPWSILFTSSHPTHIITSDPNIVVVQEITHNALSVSDYANHKFIPEPNNLKPEEIRFCHTLLWGDNSAAAVDGPIVAKVAALLAKSTKTMDVRAARSIQLSDLKTDDNFIFLGSPRSNPWTGLFSDQLDFKFVFDKTTGQEIILNTHPQKQESQTYVPTALGWATGKSYAIVAFIQNADQNGHVLLLAGANGEGTEAAGKLVTDTPRLAAVLNMCGITRSVSSQHFEMLLELNTMAQTSSHVDVLACHLLSGPSQKQ